MSQKLIKNHTCLKYSWSRFIKIEYSYYTPSKVICSSINKRTLSYVFAQHEIFYDLFIREASDKCHILQLTESLMCIFLSHRMVCDFKMLLTFTLHNFESLPKRRVYRVIEVTQVIRLYILLTLLKGVSEKNMMNMKIKNVCNCIC